METITMNSDARSTVLARRMFELRTQKAELEGRVNTIDAELDQIKLELTKLMEELGLQKFGIEGIGTYYLATSIYPKVFDADKMIAWLDDNNHGNIAPRKIHIASLRELIETSMEKDLPVPPVELVEMSSETSVRLRLSKKGA